MVDAGTITTTRGSTAAIVCWRYRGQLRLSIVVKATFAFVADGVMARVEPQEIISKEVQHGNHPGRSARLTTDLTPRLAKAEVMLTGHAYPPGGVPTETWPVRVVVLGRREPLLDKQLVVQNAAHERRVPLMLERTFGGIADTDNPLGTAEPQIVDPRAPGKPAFFSPLGRAWPSRRRRLGKTPRKALEAPIAEIPDDLDWAYFQAAPEDQQLAAPLRGDEWILLEGVSPSHRLVRTRLPGARAGAKVYGLGSAGIVEGSSVVLVCDTVRIDTDAEQVTLAWRGDLTLPGEDAIAMARIAAGVWLEGEAPRLPDPRGGDPSSNEPAIAKRGPSALVSSPPVTSTTMTLDEEDIEIVDDGPQRVEPAAAPQHVAAGASDESRTVVLDEEPLREVRTVRPTDLSKTVALDAESPEGASESALPFDRDAGASDRARAVVELLARSAAETRGPWRVEEPATEDLHDLRSAGAWHIEEPVTEDLPQAGLPPRPALPIVVEQGPSDVDLRPPELPVPPRRDPLAQTMDAAPARLDALPLEALPFALAAPGESALARPGSEAKGRAADRPSAGGDEASGTMVLSEEQHEDLGARAVLPFLTRSVKAPPRAAARARPSAPMPVFHRRRKGEAIPFVTRTPFIPFTIPWQIQAGQEARTIVVKASFDLVHRGAATLRTETELPSGDVHEGGDLSRGLSCASDFAVFKPRADVVLNGHAFAPKGGATSMEVRFELGRKPAGFQRALYVFGDRTWEGSVTRRPSAPAPFEKMPLSYERAYGGPDFAQNPIGQGRRADASGVVRLPNLESPSELVLTPDDAPAPACFGPVPPRFALRASKLGTYDARWQAKRWPYFPDDFDWAYFQHAPLAQRLELPQGDEPYVIAGAHPDVPVIDGRLAGVRARCFAQKTTEAGGAFFEVVMRLDTVTFEPDDNRVDLVWRGILEVADEHASDIAELFVLEAPVKGAQVDLEAARERFLSERDPLPLVEADPDEPSEQNDARPPFAGSARVQAKLAAAGAATGPGAAATSAEAAGAPPGVAGDEDVAPEAARPAHLDAAIDPLRKEVEARLSAGEPLDELVLDGANLTGLDLSGRSLAFTSLKDARLVACRLAGADLGGALLSGADLTDATLDDADLRGADLTGAILDGASARRVKLDAADLSAAVAPRVDLRGAEGAGARFVEATLHDARFEGASLPAADFTRADLERAVLAEAKLPEARLYEARGVKVSFKSAVLTEARATGASFVQGNMHFVDAKLSVWDDSALDGASFLGAKLSGASFAGASCQRSVFSGADVPEGAFQRASLSGATFLKANLLRASLEEADLEGADLRGANLHAAETWKARLARAKLDDAIVTGTKLEVKR